MKNNIKYLFALFTFPIMAIAQEPGITDKPSYKAHQFFQLHIGWPFLSLVFISAITLLLLFFLNKRKKNRYSLFPIFVFLLFAVWYFYPSFTYKGTYEATLGWPFEGEVATTVIDEYFGDGTPEEGFPYHLKPLRRMLWVEAPFPELDIEYFPIKLGWNNIYKPVIKVGVVKFEKEK